MENFKEQREDIRQSIIERIEEYEDTELSELHYNLFNSDYYIIGYYEAEKWLSSNVFEAIEYIKDYEIDNFGEVNTDFSSSEKVVNMLAYILGEEELNNIDCISNKYDSKLTKEIINEVLK